MSQTILSPQQLSSQSSIVNAMVQEAVQRKVITLADIAKSPEELVERVRPHAEASMTLQDYCKRVLTEQDDPGARLVAQAVYTALRANVMYAVAYRYHIQKAKPENKDINIADFKHTINLASIAYVSGNSYIHNGRVVPKEDYEILCENIACDNDDWIGTHIIGISLMDTLVNNLVRQAETDKDSMPKGYSSALSLLKIRTKNLIKDSRSWIDTHVTQSMLSKYPFIHEEWIEADISGMTSCETDVYNNFHSRIEPTRKALTIALQKHNVSIPQVRAYIYMITELVGKICLKANRLEQAAQQETKTSQKVHFRKEWNAAMDAAVSFSKIVCGKVNLVKGEDNTVGGDWNDRAVDMTAEIVKDATETKTIRVAHYGNMSILLQYVDMAIGCMAVSLRSGKGLPLSWVLCIRRIMGNKKDFRTLISQLRNPKLLRQLPTNDPIDIMEFMAQSMKQYQNVELQTDEKGEIVVAVQETNEKVLRKAVGHIVLFREYLLTERKAESDYIPSDPREGAKNLLTQYLYKDNLQLTLEHTVLMLAHFASKADFLRALKDIGPMGDKTRRILAKQRLSDFTEYRETIAAQAYRMRGYTIPTGYEHIFLQELRALAQQPEKK